MGLYETQRSFISEYIRWNRVQQGFKPLENPYKIQYISKARAPYTKA